MEMDELYNQIQTRMSVHVPNDILREEDLPKPNAPWREISAFAFSFHAYEYWGDRSGFPGFANHATKLFREHSTLPVTLSELRSCLFFEQRRKVHQSEELGEEKMKYIHALVEAIREKVKRKELD
jgi:hypothetical protein